MHAGRLATGLLLLLLVVSPFTRVEGKIAADDVPTFRLRARVTAINGKTPAKTFTLTLGHGTCTVAGSAWSGELAFTREDAAAALATYPNSYLNGYPLVTGLTIEGVEDTSTVDGEIRLDAVPRGAPLRFTARLYNSRLGLLCWREADRAPRAGTLAQYNRRYWAAFGTAKLAVRQRPRLFEFVDRYIGLDGDRIAWEEAIAAMSRAGLSLGGDTVTRPMMLQAGMRYSSWGVYNPPGYTFDFTPQSEQENTSPAGLEQWAKAQAAIVTGYGYPLEDIRIFGLADEPGWYYPSALDSLKGNAIALMRFRNYLQAQGLSPRDVGAERWEDVEPAGRSRAMDGADGAPAPLPARRLFYWTMRFFSWDSARHFALCTRAVEMAFRPNIPVATNFNFFSGRLYVPGPVANNRDKTSRDAAMGGHDWLEFGRLRGGTMLWTEDWFGDDSAPQWSFYCAKLRSAAAKSGGQFGGYVIPRVAGSRADGILQKILTIIGSGGKRVGYFTFGPDYAFPGNCYSENTRVLPKMAEAHAMVAAAEDLLWPGRPPRPQVAILSPRSAELWDCRNTPVPRDVIVDATNTALNDATVDYMSEVYNLYVALQHAGIPVDFVEEDDLLPARLAPYRVLYVTEPNIPAEGQQGLLDWTRRGGTLVLVSGAGAADRYNDPCALLTAGVGIRERPRERMLQPNLQSVTPSGHGVWHGRPFTACGPRGTLLAPPRDGIAAAFDDGTPALAQRTVGAGTALYFPWLPGLSYQKSRTGTTDGLATGFSAALRDLIAFPVRLAQATPPVTVSAALVEAPMLLSGHGAAVTLLNWTGERRRRLQVQARVPFTAKSVVSVRQGRLSFTQRGGVVTCTLPLDAVDILTFRP